MAASLMSIPHLCSPAIKFQTKKNHIPISSLSAHSRRMSERGGGGGEGGKPIKPRLALKFVLMEKNIGLAVDRVLPGYGCVPLSPYYWWPRTDAWDELKSKLEEKSWIPEKQTIVLLNQATDIINLWQQTSESDLYA